MLFSTCDELDGGKDEEEFCASTFTLNLMELDNNC